jgi:Flp pilus assembly protein TadG
MPGQRSARGAALVEFAIVLPVLLLLVLGAIDWGYYFMVQDVALNAAREGARTAMLGTDTQGETRAVAIMTAMLPAAQAAECSANAVPLADSVRMETTCEFLPISGVTEIPPFAWVMPAQARGRVEMRR